MMDKTLVARLESVTERLEKLLDRVGPPMERAAEQGEAPHEEPSPEEMAKAEAFIAAAQWRAEETLRRWEQQGGPSEEDAEAYFSSWVDRR
jgi:hypothetical protein